MAFTKSAVKYIAIMTISFMALLLLMGWITISISKFPHLFDAMIISIGVMLFLKGKVADYAIGNRCKHKPNIGLGIVLIVLILISNFGNITSDIADGTYGSMNISFYQLFVEYVGYSILYLIVIAIINAFKFRKGESEVAEVPSEETVCSSTPLNDEVGNSIEKQTVSQTPPPIKIVSATDYKTSQN